MLDILIHPDKYGTIITIGVIIIEIGIIVGVAMFHAAYATYFERKVIGRMQMRMGPMEVGSHGILQPIADGIKLFFKEDIIPTNTDKPIFFIAPVIGLMAALTSLSVIPFFESFVLSDINIGLLFILAMSSLGTYGVILAGWASNSKYAFLGGLRASAQVISYEVAMGLSLVGVMIMAGSLNLNEIIKVQHNYPTGLYLIPQFIGFFIFSVAALAETNRAPFDLPEAESELIAGYFTEYSGMRFALFFAAEYIGMMVVSSIIVICYLGGWTMPGYILAIPFFSYIPGIVWFFLKLYFCLFVFFWLRATLPRYRYDQLMSLGWKFMIPLALFNILITGLIKILAKS